MTELLGVVIGVTKPGYITFEGKEPVGLGEYITITEWSSKKDSWRSGIMFY